MSQPPYGDPNQPGQPDQPYAYPPPADPFATPAPPPDSPPPGSPQPGSPQPPAWPPPPGYPPANPYQPPQNPHPGNDPTAAYPTVPMPPGHDPNLGHPQLPPPPPPPPPPPKKSRGLLIAAIALGVAVLLCGGGGTAAYLLLKDANGQGAADPKAAVQTFLVAVYNDRDVDKANQLVCADSRDRDALVKKINQLKAQGEKQKNAAYAWPEPTVTEEKSDRATVNVTVRMTTGDEKLSEQPLTFTVVKETGWFVCEVRPTS